MFCFGMSCSETLNFKGTVFAKHELINIRELDVTGGCHALVVQYL